MDTPFNALLVKLAAFKGKKRRNVGEAESIRAAANSNDEDDYDDAPFPDPAPALQQPPGEGVGYRSEVHRGHPRRCYSPTCLYPRLCITCREMDAVKKKRRS